MGLQSGYSTEKLIRLRFLAASGGRQSIIRRLPDGPDTP